jgi:hypothetical protein
MQPVVPHLPLPLQAPVPDDNLDFDENSLRVRQPGLDMQPGDFRHITMRESYRSIVKAVWEATNATPDAWNRLAGIELRPYDDMSVNAIEERRRLEELAEEIMTHAGPYGFGPPYGGEYNLARMALSGDIMTIAKLGWQGYMEAEIAERAAAAAVAAEGPFIPAPVPIVAEANPPPILPAV